MIKEILELIFGGAAEAAVDGLQKKSSCKRPQRISSQSGRVLRHSATTKGLFTLCILLSMAIASIGLLEIPESDQFVAWLALIAVFSVAGFCGLIGSVSGCVVYSDEGIQSRSSWPLPMKRIAWKDIKSVDYSGRWEYYEIRGRDGTKISVSCRMSGIHYLLIQLLERAGSSLTPEAQRRIKSEL